jgi:Sulfatase
MNGLPLPRARTRALHLLALSAFAIAQPELQKLGKTPEYFVVRGYHAADVILFALGLVLLVPLILLAVELAAGRVNRILPAVLHQIFICLLAFLIFEDLLERHPAPWNPALLFALVVAFATAYRFWMPAQSFLTMAAFAPLLFFSVFLFKTHLGDISVSKPARVAMPVIRSHTPVVLVIFDEFAVSSLLSSDNTIDRIRYPNFAALSQTSTWYRNATTVYDVTDNAVPAILSGRLHRLNSLPSVAAHPRNLYTLLGRNYFVRAARAEARLCPENLCPDVSPSLTTRMTRMLADLKTTSIRRQPTWEGDWRTPAAEVNHFLQLIQPSKSPGLYVLHVLLPHVPYQYLPSGRAYSKARLLPGYIGRRWVRNPRYIDFNYERFLLQLGYTDEVLGKIVTRLRAAGLWNKSLFVVTADHGVSFHPGGHRRYVDLDNVGDIAPVPLFVKRPNQQHGAIDTFRARTIDIVPTIADQLGVRAPWRLDGTSLFASGRRPASRVVVRSYTGDLVRASWSRVAAGEQETLAWKLRLFGSGEDSVYAEGSDRQLLGRRVDAFPSWAGGHILARMHQPSAVRFESASRIVPSRVSGTLVGVPADRRLKIAVAVNGRIAAVASTDSAGGRVSFATLVSDSVFRTGENSITVLALHANEDGKLALARVRSTDSNKPQFEAARG